MKRFQFSLQRMLGFKRTMYERARNDLARLRAQKLALEQRRDNAQLQMLQVDADFREKAASSGVGISEVTQMSFHRDNADKLIKELNAAIALKDQEIEVQLQIVIALDKEVKSLEKLRERQWEEYQAELTREENERILELVSRRFTDAQSEKAKEEAAYG